MLEYIIGVRFQVGCHKNWLLVLLIGMLWILCFATLTCYTTPSGIRGSNDIIDGYVPLLGRHDSVRHCAIVFVYYV